MPTGGSDAYTLLINGIKAEAHAEAALFDEQFENGIRSWRLSKAEEELMRAFRDAKRVSGRAVASNRHIFRLAQDTMIDTLVDLYEQSIRQRYYFATFAWDAGVKSQHDFTMDLRVLQRKVDKTLRRLSLNGITVVDLDKLKPMPTEKGARFLFHVHCIVWKEGLFQPKKRAKELAESGLFPNFLGAPPVDFKLIQDGVVHFSRVGRYLLKRRASAKNPIPQDDGGFILRDTRKGFRPGDAVRIAEVYSHVSVFDLVRGVGPQGQLLARSWSSNLRSRLKCASPGRESQLDLREDVHRFWHTLRERHGSSNVKACRFVTSSNARALAP